MKQAKRAIVPRISLSTLMLLVVALAIGLASWQIEQSIEKVKVDVYSLRFLANELRVERPDEYVVVGHTPTRMNEVVYAVHIPENGVHELCLAVGEIPGKGVVEASQRVAILPGTRRVELRNNYQHKGKVRVLLDDEEVMVADPLESWNGLSSWGGLQHRTSTHLSADRPLTLIRKQYGSSGTGLRPGLLLWIEKTNGTDGK